MRNLSGILIAVLGAALLCSGCRTRDQTNANSYSRDGMLGATQANPNYPTSPTYHNYSVDKGVIRNVLDQYPAVRKSNIRLQGPNAYVNVDVEPGLAQDQLAEFQRELQMAVSSNLPRYRVKVKVNAPSSR